MNDQHDLNPKPKLQAMEHSPRLKGCRVRTAAALRMLDAAQFHFAGFHAIEDDDLSTAALRPLKALAHLGRNEGLNIEPVLLTKSKNVPAIINAVQFTQIAWLQLHAHWLESEIDTLLVGLNDLDITIVCLANVHEPREAQLLLERVDFVIVDHEAGGTGIAISHHNLSAFFQVVPASRTFLAGGLTSENVRDVVFQFNPYGVDVQSGIIGISGEQDFRLANAFQLAVAGSTALDKSEKPSVQVFQEYSSELWRTIDPSALNGEQIVAKLNLLATLENITPYQHNTEPVWSRIRKSLEALENLDPPLDPLWRQAALTLFANTVYIPAPMMGETWGALNMDLDNLLGPFERTHSTTWEHLHFFENDPSGMITQFFHSAGLEGRLDSEKYSRIDSTDRLAATILDLLNPVMAPTAELSLKLLIQKPNWILLVDKTLSGHSLVGDVQRLSLCQTALRNRGARVPRIIILAQLATRQALDEIANHAAEPDVTVRAAMILDQTMNLTSPSCSMVTDRRILGSARQLCRWFADTLIVPDDRFTRMRDRSGDNLEFGYRGCGLTLVDHTNCPTDSLPLLWYSQEDPSGYHGPYVRVHSRIGNQQQEVSASKWDAIANSSDLLGRFARIGECELQ